MGTIVIYYIVKSGGYRAVYSVFLFHSSLKQGMILS